MKKVEGYYNPRDYVLVHKDHLAHLMAKIAELEAARAALKDTL